MNRNSKRRPYSNSGSIDKEVHEVRCLKCGAFLFEASTKMSNQSLFVITIRLNCPNRKCHAQPYVTLMGGAYSPHVRRIHWKAIELLELASQ